MNLHNLSEVTRSYYILLCKQSLPQAESLNHNQLSSNSFYSDGLGKDATLGTSQGNARLDMLLE